MFPLPKVLFALACVMQPVDTDLHPSVMYLQSEFSEAAALLQITDDYFAEDYINNIRRMHQHLNCDNVAPSTQTIASILHGREKELSESYSFAWNVYTESQRRSETYGWRSKQIYEAELEAERRVDVYSSLLNMSRDYYTTAYRRQIALDVIRQIGEENFYAGRFPPPAPLDDIPWATKQR